MPVCARPVRSFDRFVLSVSIDLTIRESADFLTSERFIVIPLSNVNQSAFVFATNGALQGTRLVGGKHFDGQFLIAAQSESRGIHDFEAAYDGLVETDAGIPRGGGILVRIGAIDTVDLGCLEYDFSADFSPAQGGCGIRGEKRISGARRKKIGRAHV